MSSIPRNEEKENEIFDSVTGFLKEFHVGKLLFQYNAGKMKGIPVIDIFRFLLCLIFSDRSMYMQRKTGTFAAGFSKNTVHLTAQKPTGCVLRPCFPPGSSTGS